MNKIKILYGLEAAGGGALKHLTYLVCNIDKSCFEVTAILSNNRKEQNKNDLDKILSSGVRVIFMPLSGKICLVKYFLFVVRIYFFIKKNKFDIIHAHSSKAGFIFRIAGWLCRVKKIYYTPHCFYFQGKRGLKKRFFVIIEKILAKITTSIILSENEKKAALSNHIATTEKIKCINNAIDFNEYRQNHKIKYIKRKLGITGDPYIVGSIGRLVPQKDWETYILSAREVLNKYHNVVFLIVGEGFLYKKIKQLIINCDLENKIKLVGYVPDVSNIYAIMDIYVSTSLWEGLPYVFLEAMRYEIPIVATNTGDFETITNNENGFVSAVKDYKFIAEKIITLIENKDIATSLGTKANIMLTEKYSFKHFIKEHHQLYQNL